VVVSLLPTLALHPYPTMADTELEAFAKAVSRVLGWAYFLSWYMPMTLPEWLQIPVLTHGRSASFYPQPISNYARKSTLGLAIDFPTLNVFGFALYTINTAAFLYSPTIRQQYAYRHPEAPENTVRFNDFLFAAHGAVMCVIIYSQFFPRVWGFRVGKSQRASRPVLGIFCGCILGIVATILLVKWKGIANGHDASSWAWIDVVSGSPSSIPINSRHLKLLSGREALPYMCR
jgi:cystinosin